MNINVWKKVAELTEIIFDLNMAIEDKQNNGFYPK